MIKNPGYPEGAGVLLVKEPIVKRIEDFMDPKDYSQTTAIGWFFRIIAWILYGIFCLVFGGLALLFLMAFVTYVIPGTGV